MLLYLVQHGEAKSKDTDPERSLTTTGINETEKMAKYAQGLDLSIAQIYHSGKLRAEQTAQIFAQHLAPDKGVSTTDGLSPKDDPNLMKQKVLEEQGNTMLVGHLPHLEKLTSLLICGDVDSGSFQFRNSGIVCIESDNSGNWKLNWFIIPDNS